VAVYNLESHGDTEKHLNLNNKVWCEGHYLPSGKVICRVNDEARTTQQECEDRLLNRFPTFISFLNWCLKETKQEESYSGSLSLDGLTSAKELVLPKTIGGSLSLNGLTSAKELVLPKTIGGWLSLDGLTSAKELVLPKTIGGWLSLNGLTSAKELVLPKTIGGWLSLNGLTTEERQIVNELRNKRRSK
jgi:hypothetical protein